MDASSGKQIIPLDMHLVCYSALIKVSSNPSSSYIPHVLKLINNVRTVFRVKEPEDTDVDCSMYHVLLDRWRPAPEPETVD
jgi:hypothetical protein